MKLKINFTLFYLLLLLTIRNKKQETKDIKKQKQKECLLFPFPFPSAFCLVLSILLRAIVLDSTMREIKKLLENLEIFIKQNNTAVTKLCSHQTIEKEKTQIFFFVLSTENLALFYPDLFSSKKKKIKQK